MHDFRPAGGERVRVVVTKVVQELGFGGLVRIAIIDAVHVGPNHQLIGIDGVRDNRAGKIGAVAAQRGDAAVQRGADETSNHGNYASVEKREKQFAAASASS